MLSVQLAGQSLDTLLACLLASELARALLISASARRSGVLVATVTRNDAATSEAELCRSARVSIRIPEATC